MGGIIMRLKDAKNAALPRTASERSGRMRMKATQTASQLRSRIFQEFHETRLSYTQGGSLLFNSEGCLASVAVSGDDGEDDMAVKVKS